MFVCAENATVSLIFLHRLQLSKEKKPKKPRPNSVSDLEETDDEDDLEQEAFLEEGPFFPTVTRGIISCQGRFFCNIEILYSTND